MAKKEDMEEEYWVGGRYRAKLSADLWLQQRGEELGAYQWALLSVLRARGLIF
jgi:hypothetical protein